MNVALAAVLAASLRLVASHDPGSHRADFARWGGYPDGAPPGFSGGFREESCHACHFHQELNAAPRQLVVAGVPATITPGQRYTVTIMLSREGMKRAGFQLAARFKNDGAQAGALLLSATDPKRVKIEKQGGVLYAGHNTEGSEVAGSGQIQWSVDWVAPAGGGPVVFNIAANAADGDERVDGDFVYTAVLEAASPPPD